MKIHHFFFWYCSLHPGHMPLLRTKVKRVFVTQMKDTRVMKKEDFPIVTSRSLSCLESNFSCMYFPYWAKSKTTCVLANPKGLDCRIFWSLCKALYLNGDNFILKTHYWRPVNLFWEYVYLVSFLYFGDKRKVWNEDELVLKRQSCIDLVISTTWIFYLD